MEKHRQGIQDNVLWVSVIATLSLCLWFSNLLPIQRVDHELITNVAVSFHRLPLLQDLLHKDCAEPTGTDLRFQLVAITPLEYEVNSNFRSEMVSARLILRLPKRPSIKEIESVLSKLTEPQGQDASCVKLANEIRNERWQLESNRHSLHRLELDYERDRKAASEIGDEAQQSVRIRAEGPFKLASFSFDRESSEPHLELQRELDKKAAMHVAKIEEMTLALDRLREKSKGFLSFTGSPRVMPIAHSLSWSRYMILSAVCFACWGIMIGWLIPSSRLCAFVRRYNRVPKVSSLDSTIAHLSSVGIPYFGEICVPIYDNVDTLNPLNTTCVDSVTHSHAPTTTERETRLSPHGLRLQSECLLFAWVLAFVFRYAFDATWRELVSTAPLAAISRLIFGIQ